MTHPVISPTGGWISTIIFVLLFLAALVLFGLRVGELITLLAKARREDRTDHIDDRIGEFFLVVLGQSGALRDPIPGIADFFTFWGFIVIQFGLLNLILGAFNGSLPLLGDNHTFAIVLDAFVVFVLIALLLFAFRRSVVRPKQLSSFLHGPWDGYIILGLILAVIVFLALVEAFEFAAYATAYGVSKAEQFTWKQLLDGYACTECGRCNTVCPATNTGKPLFPKEIILGVKEALFVRSGEILGADSLYNRLGIAGVSADKTPDEK